MPQAQKDIILMHGNCHSNSIRAFLVSLPEFAEDYDFFTFHYPSEGIQAQKASEETRRQVKDFVDANRSRIKLVLNGVTKNFQNEELDKSRFSSDTVVIDHPTHLISFMWPFTQMGGFYDITQRKTGAPEIETQLAKLKADITDENRLLEAYYAIDVVSKYKLDLVLDINARIAGEIDSLCSFPLWPFVAERLRTMHVHTSFGHPGGEVFAEILRRVCGLSGMIRDHTNLEEKLGIMRQGYGVNPSDEMPVHPAIAAHFGLAWAKDKAYRYLDRPLKYDAYLRHLSRFMDEALYTARENAERTGDVTDVVKIYREKVSQFPDDPYLRKELAECLLKSEHSAEAYEHAVAAFNMAETQTHGRTLLRAMHKLGYHYEIKHMLEILCNKFPQSVQIALIKAQTLVNKRQHEEALAHLEAVATALLGQNGVHSLYHVMSEIHQKIGNPALARKMRRLAYLLNANRDDIGQQRDALNAADQLPLASAA